MKTQSAKIAISAEADQGLDRMVKIANEGFSGGRVTKNDLTSWAVLYFEAHSFKRCIESIRRHHFDEVAYLDSIVHRMRKARKTGESAPDLKLVLSGLKKNPQRSHPNPLKSPLKPMQKEIPSN